MGTTAFVSGQFSSGNFSQGLPWKTDTDVRPTISKAKQIVIDE